MGKRHTGESETSHKYSKSTSLTSLKEDQRYLFSGFPVNLKSRIYFVGRKQIKNFREWAVCAPPVSPVHLHHSGRRASVLLNMLFGNKVTNEMKTSKMKHISLISVIFLNVEFYLDHFQIYYFKKIKQCISLRAEVLIKHFFCLEYKTSLNYSKHKQINTQHIFKRKQPF